MKLKHHLPWQFLNTEVAWSGKDEYFECKIENMYQFMALCLFEFSAVEIYTSGIRTNDQILKMELFPGYSEVHTALA
jgi:hypothetical protein